MPDAYDRDRAGFENHERGRIFENGADRFFRDRERGFTRQSEKYKTPAGRTTFDKIKKDDRGRVLHTIEEKSGRLEGRKDETQLRAIRHLLRTGEIERHTLRTVEGEPVSSTAKQLIREMIAELGDKFEHQRISRADAREIWARGLQREPNQQLELPGVREKAREQRTQQREEKARLQHEAAERLAHQQQREAAIRAAQQKQREAAERTAESARRAREAAARGQREPPTRQEIADILAVSQPTPGIDPIHRHPPARTRRGIDPRTRGREHGLDLGR